MRAWKEYDRAIEALRDAEDEIATQEDTAILAEIGTGTAELSELREVFDQLREESERARSLVGDHAPSVLEMLCAPMEVVPDLGPFRTQVPPWRVAK